MGFVFAPSPRHVTESEVAGIVARLPKTVETIGVFVDATVEEIYSAVRMCHLTGVQLHWDAADDLPGRLKSRLGRELRVLRVAHFGEGAAELVHIGQAVMVLGGTVDYFIDTVFNYPTLAECYKVAAFNGVGRLNRYQTG